MGIAGRSADGGAGRRQWPQNHRAALAYVLDALRVRDWRARGFALGLAAHGIGTARAFQVNIEAGTYAGLAFGLHGVFAAFLLPLIWRLSRFAMGSL
jgi:putative effector of murein hydrolase